MDASIERLARTTRALSAFFQARDEGPKPGGVVSRLLGLRGVAR